MATTTAWPDATNTGVPAGTVLTPYNGDLVISTPGAVVSGLDIHGTVTITAPNVTLVNCQVSGTGFIQVHVLQGVTGATVENCTINGGTAGGNGIQGTGSFLNNNIYNIENGVAVDGSASPTLIQGNYIHDLNAPGSPHYDAIQIDGGGLANITIEHNSLINNNGQTSVIMIDNYYGSVSNVLVDNNILVGGDYTVYDDAHFGAGPITGVSFTNNHMGAGIFGITDFNGANPVYTGNVNDGAALAATLNTAANTGGSASSPATPPSAAAAPVIASFSPDTGVVGDHITNANKLTITGTADPNSTITVYDGSAKLGTATASSTGSWDYITSVLTDAKHMLTATETNSSGQTSAASAALAVTVDTHAPAAPVLVSDSVVNTNHVQLSGTAEANSTVTVYDGTTVVGTGTTSSTGAFSVTTTALSGGTHGLTATATDAAGNVSAASQPLDPLIPAAAPPPTTPAGSTGLVKVGNNYFLDTVGGSTGPELKYGGAAVTAGEFQDWTPIAAVQLAGGGYDVAWKNSSGQFTFWTTDSHGNFQSYPTHGVALAGNSTTVESYENIFHQDLNGDGTIGIPGATPTPTSAAAPHLVSFSTDTGVVGDHITSDNTPTVTGTAVANSTVTLFDGTTKIGTATANANGQWSLTTKALSDGTHSLTATDTDSSGHTSTASAAFAVTVDTHAPNAPTMAAYSQGGSAVGHTTSLNDLVLKGTAEANSTVHIFDSGNQIGTATSSNAGTWSFDTGNLANGGHSFTSTAVDVAGNASGASTSDSVTVTAPSTSAAKPIEFTNASFTVANHTATVQGTADAYSQVKLYDGTTLLGNTTASANGTWSWTNSHLLDTLHTITAQEVDSSGHVIATSSGAAMLMGSNTSTLTGTGGDDFMYSSSSNMNDTFVFASNFGHSTIQGFTATGSGHDTVQFSKSVFDSFASVLSHASQVGQDVVVSSGGETLKLLNTKLGALNSHDFHFA